MTATRDPRPAELKTLVLASEIDQLSADHKALLSRLLTALLTGQADPLTAFGLVEEAVATGLSADQAGQLLAFMTRGERHD